MVDEPIKRTSGCPTPEELANATPGNHPCNQGCSRRGGPVCSHAVPQEPWTHREYLGDGVYAHWDGFQVWLTTEYGFGPTNKIALDAGTFSSLVSYAKRVTNNG